MVVQAVSTATETRPCGRCETETPINRLYSSGTGIFVCTACEDALEAQAETNRAAQRLAQRIVAGTESLVSATVVLAHYPQIIPEVDDTVFCSCGETIKGQPVTETRAAERWSVHAAEALSRAVTA